jgi:16S rRNA (guanine966-N2)-methyltransferase
MVVIRRRSSNQLRIIGGAWRSRYIDFPAIDSLRPTPDRVRETLFNWLAPCIQGAHCLDLFAGSGALGLEALSRGAAEVVFVDQHPVVIRQLHENFTRLGIVNACTVQADTVSWLTGPSRPFDVVFLDPPFGQDLIMPLCFALEERGWLASPAWVYLESEQSLTDLKLPTNWHISREKTAGRVTYRLAIRKL